MPGIDGRYFGNLWNRYLANPEAVTPDWRNAFDFIRCVYGNPAASQPIAGFAEAGDDPRAYLRRYGHRHAALDPLGLSVIPELPPASGEHAGLLAAYAGSLAVETGHIDDPAIHDWIVAAFEAPRTMAEPAVAEREILDRLIETESFDRFLAAKYPGKKRFGSEGADAILPLLALLRREAAAVGVDEIVMGSMHRGRLSVLHNFVGMEAGLLLGLFGGRHPFGEASDLPADVAYHFGHSDERDGVRTTLLPNPSHLEAVNPVVAGFARARRCDGSGRAMALIVHTDASIVGQGVNAELIQMGDLPGFTVGGTVHVVINNQIGFTTNPHEARSSLHCTGPWRAIDSLILHVNGDDLDAVARAATLAIAYRARFARDVVIDLVCYRRGGHNEIDEPRFTQPLYYRAADAKRSVIAAYEERLVAAGRVSQAEVDARRRQIFDRLEAAWAAAPSTEIVLPEPPRRNAPDAIALDDAALREIVMALAHVEAGTGAPKMVQLMARRQDELAAGIGWPLAEAMALGATLRGGRSVRLCGQDVERGPFSQRHLAAIDPASGHRSHPIAVLARDGATIEIVNSPLSEYAVLGFEYGHSLGSAGTLCLWEAQFGDFANGAQIMIDQFIASAAEKWRLRSDLIVLLPHGLEGQGPEHSSARIERLLQLCARDNIRLMHPSTPANHYHLLREQALAGDRPLFVITPKVLLRLPQARSPLAAFADTAGFQPLIASVPDGARRAVLCSGKIAYELEKARDEASLAIAVIRIEALYPFPHERLVEALAASGATEMLWLQEEPENFGAGSWLAPKLARIATATGLELLPSVARAESASPAGSFHGRHKSDQDALLARALGTEG
jgi:2-oxoglutarate dehydrogenase E1 component